MCLKFIFFKHLPVIPSNSIIIYFARVENDTLESLSRLRGVINIPWGPMWGYYEHVDSFNFNVVQRCHRRYVFSFISISVFSSIPAITILKKKRNEENPHSNEIERVATLLDGLSRAYRTLVGRDPKIRGERCTVSVEGLKVVQAAKNASGWARIDRDDWQNLFPRLSTWRVHDIGIAETT